MVMVLALISYHLLAALEEGQRNHCLSVALIICMHFLTVGMDL